VLQVQLLRSLTDENLKKTNMRNILLCHSSPRKANPNETKRSEPNRATQLWKI